MTPTDTDTRPDTPPRLFTLDRTRVVLVDTVIALPFFWGGWQALDALKGWIL